MIALHLVEMSAVACFLQQKKSLAVRCRAVLCLFSPPPVEPRTWCNVALDVSKAHTVVGWGLRTFWYFAQTNSCKRFCAAQKRAGKPLQKWSVIVWMDIGGIRGSGEH